MPGQRWGAAHEVERVSESSGLETAKRGALPLQREKSLRSRICRNLTPLTMYARSKMLAPVLLLALLPGSLGGSADQIEESGKAIEECGGGLGSFPRFFNPKTMRRVEKDDSISYGYAAFIPAARPTYDARMDVSLPLARRINAGYRLPNVFEPGEWAPLRRFCSPPERVVDANGNELSTRHFTQPVSWYTLLKTLFGIPCCLFLLTAPTTDQLSVRHHFGTRLQPPSMRRVYPRDSSFCRL